MPRSRATAQRDGARDGWCELASRANDDDVKDDTGVRAGVRWVLELGGARAQHAATGRRGDEQ